MGPLGGVLSNRILISKVGINNNSPRIFKRSFHSTNSLFFPLPFLEGYDFFIGTLDIIQLTDLKLIVTNAKISILAEDFSNPSITKVIEFLSGIHPRSNLNTINANIWGFDPNLLQGDKIRTPEFLAELSATERTMDKNLDNVRNLFELNKQLARGEITKAAYDLSLRTN